MNKEPNSTPEKKNHISRKAKITLFLLSLATAVTAYAIDKNSPERHDLTTETLATTEASENETIDISDIESSEYVVQGYDLDMESVARHYCEENGIDSKYFRDVVYYAQTHSDNPETKRNASIFIDQTIKLPNVAALKAAIAGKPFADYESAPEEIAETAGLDDLTEYLVQDGEDAESIAKDICLADGIDDPEIIALTTQTLTKINGAVKPGMIIMSFKLEPEFVNRLDFENYEKSDCSANFGDSIESLAKRYIVGYDEIVNENPQLLDSLTDEIVKINPDNTFDYNNRYVGQDGKVILPNRILQYQPGYGTDANY